MNITQKINFSKLKNSLRRTITERSNRHSTSSLLSLIFLISKPSYRVVEVPLSLKSLMSRS